MLVALGEAAVFMPVLTGTRLFVYRRGGEILVMDFAITQHARDGFRVRSHRQEQRAQGDQASHGIVIRSPSMPDSIGTRPPSQPDPSTYLNQVHLFQWTGGANGNDAAVKRGALSHLIPPGAP
ncbi:MAG: hypothetical protein ACRELX_03435, partial [Longimicrobiales bacterium]